MRIDRLAAAMAISTVVASSLIAVSSAQATDAAARPPEKPMRPVRLAAGPAAASQDFGDVAVLVDNGLMVTPRNLFDLNGEALRFEPAGSDAYVVSRTDGEVEGDPGPALTFGHPAATLYPGDDDSQAVGFAAGFPFFGTTYTSVWVNTDGNVTFGSPDFASNNRDKARHVLGPPRVSAFLLDVNAHNALNPAGSGSIHAVAKSNPDRLVVTWDQVADFLGGMSSTFQIRLYASGVVEIVIDEVDAATKYGVTGIARGDGGLPLQIVDFTSPSSLQTYEAGAIMEAFAEFADVDRVQVAREFYKTHADTFDYLMMMSDFSADFIIKHHQVSNQTHGIGTPLVNGSPEFGSTVYDESAAYGSGGELEEVHYLNNISLLPTSADGLVNPPVEPYRTTANFVNAGDVFGWPVTLDGQTMSQFRNVGSIPPDQGEISRFFDRSGQWTMGTFSAMSMMVHEIAHRYGAYARFVHPTKGIGFDSYDLLGLDTQHWSYFFNTAVSDTQFLGAPRSSANLGNHILDLGAPAAYNGVATDLEEGERLFVTPPDELADGFSALDQHLMGIRRAEDVGPFWYVDEPRSIYTGQSLDEFNPENPLNTSSSMRAWIPQGGIAYGGRRVDLTIEDMQAYEAERDGNKNPTGVRFWGEKGKLKVRYNSSTGRVDPGGDATVTLSQADRELGDEADHIDAGGKPVDVKTTAFVLVVESGSPSSHTGAIERVNAFREVWQDYVNGPATGGRGRFDTSLTPAIH